MRVKFCLAEESAKMHEARLYLGDGTSGVKPVSENFGSRSARMSAKITTHVDMYFYRPF